MNSKVYVQIGGKSIETTVTNRSSVATDWVLNIRSNQAMESTVVVGLDIEWKPNNGQLVRNKPATLQLCNGCKCLILQLIHMDNGIPEALKTFLSDTKFVFVGVDVAADVAKMREGYGIVCARTADIGDLAMAKWPGKYSQRPGLKELAKQICGLDLLKADSVRTNDWEVVEVSSAQIEYACVDAYASFVIGRRLILGN